ncbi:MAG: GNAT family N-acetyltransferase [Bacteroidota bacterium]
MEATPTPTFAIRPINAADNAVLAQLIRNVMTEFSCVGEGFSIMDPEMDDLYATYSQAGSAFFALTLNGKIVGCAGIGPLKGGEATTCELRKMYFLPEARGFGWGQKILEHCLLTAKELGYQLCYLETVNWMKTANQLYQKFGFESLDNQLGATGHSSCNLFYAKTL